MADFTIVIQDYYTGQNPEDRRYIHIAKKYPYESYSEAAQRIGNYMAGRRAASCNTHQLILPEDPRLTIALWQAMSIKPAVYLATYDFAVESFSLEPIIRKVIFRHRNDEPTAAVSRVLYISRAAETTDVEVESVVATFTSVSEHRMAKAHGKKDYSLFMPQPAPCNTWEAYVEQIAESVFETEISPHSGSVSFAPFGDSFITLVQALTLMYMKGYYPEII